MFHRVYSEILDRVPRELGTWTSPLRVAKVRKGNQRIVRAIQDPDEKAG